MKPKFYYGWYIAGIAMLGTGLSASISQLFMGVMLKPMTEDVGWSRTAGSGAISLGTVTAGLLSPIMGRLTDRYGPRLLTTLGALVVVAAQLLIANLSELWQFYLVFLVGRSVGATTVAGVVPVTAVTNWFRRMRGRVMGLITMSLSLGGTVIVFAGQLIVDAHGWRMAFVVFAVVMLVVLVPPAALLLRRRPEDIGLRPDGDTVGGRGPARGKGDRSWGLGDGETERGEQGKGEKREGETSSKRATSGEEFSWTFAEARRTPALWLMTLGVTLGSLGTAGVGFHLVPYYTDMGIRTTLAALAVSAYALSGAVASTIWGFLSERLSERKLAVASFLLGSGVVFALIFVRTPEAAVACGMLLGVAARGEATLVNVLLGQYFGRTSFGAINGVMLPFQQGGLGAGPVVASLIFDLTGSYHTGFVLFSAAYAVGAACFWLARKPPLPARAYA